MRRQALMAWLRKQQSFENVFFPFKVKKLNELIKLKNRKIQKMRMLV